MPPTRSRAVGLAVAAALTLTILPGPATAADSPAAAADGLLDAVEAGDYEAIDDLVCEAERDAVRAMLDPGEAMGMEEARELLTFHVEDRSVEVVEQDDVSATVRLTGSMSIDLGDGDVEAIARSLVEADLGEVSDEDLEMMLPFMEMALTQTLPLDEELTSIVEDGEWVICGGLGESVGDDGLETTVSSEGICALATPAELTELGSLEYDSSGGFETFCTYSNSDFEDYHQTSVTVEFDRDASSTAQAYGADQEVEVAGAQAWAPGPEGFGTNLITQAGPDIIVVTVGAPESAPDDFDWLAQATAITELLVPRLAANRTELAGPAPDPTPEPTPEVPLCAEGFLDELNEQTGLGLDVADVSGTSCSFNPVDMEPGFHFINAYVGEASLDDYLLWLPDPEETEIAGLRALVIEGQSILELPGGEQVLEISVILDTNDESLSTSAAEVTRLVAEHIVSNLAD